MKIALVCEESQAVCVEFRKMGFDAYSCDILPPSGPMPEYHIQGDAREILNDGWDAIIGFPPCTDLAVSGAAWFKRKRESGEQRAAIEFFMDLWNAPCEYVAMENPVGILSGEYIKKHFPDLCEKYGLPMKPSQIIEPWQFGDHANKKTCLWLRGFPDLIPTKIVSGSKYIKSKSGKSYPDWCWNTGGGSGKIRSKTFPGIARAMAQQWGEYLKTINTHTP